MNTKDHLRRYYNTRIVADKETSHVPFVKEDMQSFPPDKGYVNRVYDGFFPINKKLAACNLIDILPDNAELRKNKEYSANKNKGQ